MFRVRRRAYVEELEGKFWKKLNLEDQVTVMTKTLNSDRRYATCTNNRATAPGRQQIIMDRAAIMMGMVVGIIVVRDSVEKENNNWKLGRKNNSV